MPLVKRRVCISMDHWRHLYGVAYSLYGGHAASDNGLMCGVYECDLGKGISGPQWKIGSILVEYHIQYLEEIPHLNHGAVHMPAVQFAQFYD